MTRKIFRYIITFIFFIASIPIILNIEEITKKHGFDKVLVDFESKNIFYSLVNNNYYLLLFGIILGSTLTSWILRIYSSKELSQDIKSLNDIVKKTFKNETVVLDGNNFVNCIFNNCTMQYGGGLFNLSHPTFVPNCKPKFTDYKAHNGAKLLHLLHTTGSKFDFLDKYDTSLTKGLLKHVTIAKKE
jgi:hypothetical protein